MSIIIRKLGIPVLVLAVLGCGNRNVEKAANLKSNPETDAGKLSENKSGVVLTQRQFEALQIKVEGLQTRSINGFVEANGQLEVPPQNEASVTSVIGANVASIEVIEGDEVKKGEVLLYLSHPDIIEKQSDYLNAFSKWRFLKKEYERQLKLYEAGVGSGASFQKAEAEFQASEGFLKGMEAQLQQLNVGVEAVKDGRIQQKVAVRSPIEGSVQKVYIKTGQYADPQTTLMEVVNTHHVHADLMVFEKDVHRIAKGQEVRFTVHSFPGKELNAEIYSVGKTFEENPKALHVHAEITNKAGNLIPGMYIRGQILTDSLRTLAIPEEGIARDGGRVYVFRALQKGEHWEFTPVEVIPGTRDGKWVAVNFLTPEDPDSQFAYNNAFYLMAEMKKGEAEHSH